MKGQLPVVSFRPEGEEAFMALMTLMVGVKVEVTYLRIVHNWDLVNDREADSVEMDTMRGEIVAINDVGIALKPYGVPKRYHEGQYRNREVAWRFVKMLEVIGA